MFKKILFMLIFIMPLSTQAATCKKNGHDDIYWYECDGIQMTQNASGNSKKISDFKMHNDIAIWKFYEADFMGSFHQYAYYARHISSGINGQIEKLTQDVNTDGNHIDMISNIVFTNNYVIWNYYQGKEYASGSLAEYASGSHAYYIRSLMDGKTPKFGKMYKLTQDARRDNLKRDSITEFQIVDNSVVWKYFNGNQEFDNQVSSGTAVGTYAYYLRRITNNLTSGFSLGVIQTLTQSGYLGVSSKRSIYDFKVYKKRYVAWGYNAQGNSDYYFSCLYGDRANKSNTTEIHRTSVGNISEFSSELYDSCYSDSSIVFR